MSDSVRPHRQQPTRLPRPWDSPGKNTGVDCHFLPQCMKVKSESEVAQSCPTLSNPMGCSLPGSSVHGIFQARVLEWGAIAFSVSPSTNINSKWIKDIKLRPEILKVLEENTGRTLSDINHNSSFYQSISKGKRNKSKKKQIDLIKRKCFSTKKETTDKMKGQLN